jgi:hypothetical protein
LDPKAVRGLVATPDFYAARSLDLLVRFNREFLAGRGQMARASVALANGRWILCHLLSGPVSRGTNRITKEHWALHVSATGIMSIGFLALLSIQFDFGNCINPSQAHPYFTSGRLLSGALIPFALFYVYGIAFLFRRINAALPLVVLGMIVVFVTASEIAINRVVFSSEHNWFHL